MSKTIQKEEMKQYSLFVNICICYFVIFDNVKKAIYAQAILYQLYYSIIYIYDVRLMALPISFLLT